MIAPMNEQQEWIDVGAADDFKRTPLREARLGERLVAISYKDGKFGVISNVCNHVGGPLGKGVLEGEFVVCPWHQYRFHRCSGEGEPGYEADKVPSYGVREENGRLLVTAKPVSKRGHLPHEPHPLTRSTETRAPGPLRVGERPARRHVPPELDAGGDLVDVLPAGAARRGRAVDELGARNPQRGPRVEPGIIGHVPS